MNAPPARAQAREIQRSLHCFILGGLGLLPVIGFPLALLALMAFRRVCVENRGRWNPARAYLIWGFVLGSIGVLFSLGVFFFLLLSLLANL
ncbi:MAG TPA: hypothetical protein VI136_11260 [Verrucomicrobiae bacterium]